MIRTQVLKHLPGERKGVKEGSKRNVRGRATAEKSIDKNRCVRVIEGKEVRGDNPIEHFVPTGAKSTFLVPKGVIAVEVPQNKKGRMG